MTQLAIAGDNIYVLDDGLDRLYRYKLTPDGKGVQEPSKHTVVMKREDKVDGTELGELLSITWMPAGQLRTTPALFALETGRSIVAFDQNDNLSRVEVAENQKWGTIQAISGFAGGLYLLDTKLKAILYYPPTKNGYESEPYTIVDARAKIDLSKAVDIALDGNLYVLESEGNIRRFNREGQPFDFAAELPDGPMKEPKVLFASADTRSLYVVDSQGRIIQFLLKGHSETVQNFGQGRIFQRDSRHLCRRGWSQDLRSGTQIALRLRHTADAVMRRTTPASRREEAKRGLGDRPGRGPGHSTRASAELRPGGVKCPQIDFLALSSGEGV